MLFPGERIESLEASGDCGENGCQDGVCDPPGDAFIRLLEPERLPTWSLRKEQDVTISRSKYDGTDGGIDLHVKLAVDWVPEDSLVAGGPDTVRFEVIPEAVDDRPRIGKVGVRWTGSEFPAGTVFYRHALAALQWPWWSAVGLAHGRGLPPLRPVVAVTDPTDLWMLPFAALSPCLAVAARRQHARLRALCVAMGASSGG